MTDRRIRLAVVGCRRISANHVEPLAGHAGVDGYVGLRSTGVVLVARRSARDRVRADLRQGS